MIRINKIKNEKTILSLIDKYSLESGVNDLFLEANDNGNILEFIQYENIDDEVRIKYISDISGDYSVTDGLMKTLLFMCDTSKIKNAVLPAKYFRTAKALGFADMGESFVLKLEDYENHCACSGKE